MESGYKKATIDSYSNENSNTSITYPHRVYSSGMRGALGVVLRLYDYNFDYLCRGPVLGFKILLHSPDELPQISKHFIRVPLSTETRITVRPVVTTVTKELMSYNLKL